MIHAEPTLGQPFQGIKERIRYYLYYDIYVNKYKHQKKTEFISAYSSSLGKEGHMVVLGGKLTWKV